MAMSSAVKQDSQSRCGTDDCRELTTDIRPVAALCVASDADLMEDRGRNDLGVQERLVGEAVSQQLRAI